MKNRDILLDHYRNLLRRAGLWIGLVSIAASSFVSMPASAAQLTTRKAILSPSAAASATGVSYDMFFTNGSTSAALGIKAIRFQFCTSPLYNTGCTLPTGLVRGTGITTQTNNGSGMTNAFTAAVSGSNDVLLSNATGNTFTSGQIINIKLNGFTNPSATNTQYYVRVQTCTTTACNVPADVADNGAMALSTSTSVAVSGTVQENLVFCSGTSGTPVTDCTPVSGNSVSLGTPMSTGFNTGSSKLYAATNAGTGYVIQYYTSNINTGLCAGNNGFCDTNSGQIGSNATYTSPVSAASEMYGVNLVSNTTPAVGAAATGDTASITYGGSYGTANTFKFNDAGGDTLVTKNVPSSMTTYTVAYMANITATTKPGSYAVNMNYVCTGIF